MKELHNHIFSNTTCISKEIMLRYINKQLSVKELHEVEKHMLDCELCTDALAGIKYAENSSMLFAIDNQIDQRVRMGQTRAPLMRNLMVAASLLIIVFGSYFTFNFFEKTLGNDATIAITNEKLPITEEENDGFVPVEEQVAEPLIDNSVANAERKDNAAELSYVAPEIMELEESEDAEITIADIVADEMIVERNEADDRDNFNTLQNQKNNQSTGNTPQLGAVSASGNIKQEAEKEALNKDLDNSNKRDKSKDVRKAKSKKEAFKSRAKVSTPAYKKLEMMDAEATEEELVEEIELTKEYRSTITYSDHKVVDYIDEFQQQYDLNQVIETKTESVSAGFATKDDMKKAEKEREEGKVEITYKATLQKAMAYYKTKNYVMALDEFNVILKEHPEEVNALFYGGLSYYHLDKNTEALNKLDKVLVNKKTEFNQEAKWYKALTLIELKQTDKAKNLLQQIVTENGFYKANAEERLKGLK